MPSLAAKPGRKVETMATDAQIRAVAKYDKKNTVGVYLKLNIETDADILAKLETVENRQGYIKSLIRADMAKEGAA